MRVVLGDGALGNTDGAPYDLIIATVGAWGLPSAWLEQLAPDGRLVVPLRLRGSVSRSDRVRARQRTLAQHQERNVHLHAPARDRRRRAAHHPAHPRQGRHSPDPPRADGGRGSPHRRARSALPDLARSLCWQQFDVYLRARPLGAQVARYMLEPIFNLARLLIREGNGKGAHQLLNTLYHAVRPAQTPRRRIRLAPCRHRVAGLTAQAPLV